MNIHEYWDKRRPPVAQLEIVDVVVRPEKY